MSSELLRRAASLMRERAEGVTPGAQWTGGHYWITDYDPSDPSGQTAMQRLIGGMDGPDADHYSALSPDVARAVADWLGSHALEHNAHLVATGRAFVCTALTCPAITVARAYLGETT